MSPSKKTPKGAGTNSKVPSAISRIINLTLHLTATLRDLQTPEEVVSLRHAPVIPGHVNVVALKLVQDVNGGHAGVKVLPIVIELEVIDGHEVVVLTVGKGPLEGDCLRSVVSSISVVSE